VPLPRARTTLTRVLPWSGRRSWQSSHAFRWLRRSTSGAAARQAVRTQTRATERHRRRRSTSGQQPLSVRASESATMRVWTGPCMARWSCRTPSTASRTRVSRRTCVGWTACGTTIASTWSSSSMARCGSRRTSSSTATRAWTLYCLSSATCLMAPIHSTFACGLVPKVYTRAHTHTHTHTHVHTHACMHTHTRAHAYIYT